MLKVGCELDGLAAPTQNHISASGLLTRNWGAPSQLCRAPAPPEVVNYKVCLALAIRRHDTGHAHVFHHLAIMIVAVPDDKSG